MFAVLFQIHGGGGEGEVHAVFLHHVHQVKVQIVLHLQKAGHVGGAQVGGHQQVDAGSAEAAQLHQHRVLVGVGAGLEHGGQVCHQLLQLRTGGIVGDPEGEAVQPLVAQGAVVDGGRADRAVGQDVHRVIQCADLGGAEVDVHHLAGNIAHGDPVTDGKGPVQQDDQPAEQIFGAVLRRQRDGQTDKTCTGYDAAHRQAGLLCHSHNAQYHDENFVQLVQQGGQGAVGAHLLAAVCQQKVGKVGGGVQSLTHKKGGGQLKDCEQKFAHAADRPRQAGSCGIDERRKGEPLQRHGKAAQQNGRTRQPPAAAQQGRAHPAGQKLPRQPAKHQQQRRAHHPGGKGCPAFQQQRAQLKTKVTDRENHGKPPVLFHNAYYDSILCRPGQGKKGENTL